MSSCVSSDEDLDFVKQTTAEKEKPYIAPEISDAHSVDESSNNKNSPFNYQLLSWFYCVFNLCFTLVKRNFNLMFVERIASLKYPMSFVIAGSLAEETCVPGKSDVDIMCLSNSCIVCDHEDSMVTPIDKKIYVADRKHASPGYTLVLMSINAENPLDIKHAKRIKHYHCKIDGVSGEEHGPSNKYSSNEVIQSFIQIQNIKKIWDIPADAVFAIPFLGKSDLFKWFNRRRYFEWPSRELQQEIFGMSGYVVPVGHRGSKYERIEWRICYTTAEIKLIRSWNDVQRLLYIKLKQFAYNSVQLICPDITSYIIKNLMFWIAESVPGNYFKCGNFLPLFRSTLHVLKRCVEKKHLPNYMIPERNLFDGKLEDCDENRKLNVLLSYCISSCAIFNQDEVSLAGAVIEGCKSEPECLAKVVRAKRLNQQFIEIFYKECFEETTEEKKLLSVLKFSWYINTEVVNVAIFCFWMDIGLHTDSESIKALGLFSCTFCSILRRLLHKSTATTTTLYQRVHDRTA